jgi:signal peptidase
VPGKNRIRIPEKYKPVVLFLRDAGLALAIVLCVLLGMYAYTGLWPPLVVIESDSMMHSEENVSQIGAIDTGDLVLVKDVDGRSDVVTYIEGFVSGHKTYGDFGDVIVYKKYGMDIYTPIIHRAIVFLEVNTDGESYRCDALRLAPSEKWATSNPSDTWDSLTSRLTIYSVGFRTLPVVIEVDNILSSFMARSLDPQSGYITKGDHNTGTDQSLGGDFGFRPVEIDWVIGKARGEIPWFGLLKLWATDSAGSPSPPNSVRDLWISLGVIVTVPIVVDFLVTYKIRRKIAAKKEQALKEEKSRRNKPAPDTEDKPPPQTSQSSDERRLEP